MNPFALWCLAAIFGCYAAGLVFALVIFIRESTVKS